MKKPIKVFYSQWSGRFYASQYYKHTTDSIVTITGEKYDVTDDIGAAVKKYDLVFRVPTSLDWEVGRQVGMQQVTPDVPDVPMHLSLTDDRLQEDEFISSKPEMSREITRLREQLKGVQKVRDEYHQQWMDASDAEEALKQQLATAQDRIEELEQALRLTLSVDPDDPILIIPKEAQP